MKTILINLLSIVRKFKFATCVNLVGLSVAFAAFLVILMHVHHEYTFEEYHIEPENIYHAQLMGETYSQPVFTRGQVDEIIDSSPYIEAATLINVFGGELTFTVGEGENKTGYFEKVWTCYPGMTEVFNFQMVEGDSGCLEEPGHILIPQQLARRLFGEESAIGKQLKMVSYVWTLPWMDYLTVGGVYKDFPTNTILENIIYAPIEKSLERDFSTSAYYLYVRINKNVNIESIAENYNDKFYVGERAKDDLRLTFQPLLDIHFAEGGNKTTTNVLLLIAFLVIGIAAVNYVNFSTALAPMRMKSINTQKVLGSSDRVLRYVLVGEAVMTCLLSCLLACGIIYYLDHINYLTFIQVDISLIAHPGILLFTFLLAFFIGLVAGLYPAYYLTAFPPALVLKGTYGLSPGGRKLRIALLGFQFFISFALIISSLFIQQQNRFLLTHDLGFDTERIAIAKIGGGMYKSSKDTYVNKLKEYPGIEDVAFAGQRFGGTTSFAKIEGSYKDQSVGVVRMYVSHNFFSVMGVDLLEGHQPTPMHEQGETRYGILTKNIWNEHEMEVDSRMGIYDTDFIHLLGVTEDLKYGTLRDGTLNTCFFIAKEKDALPFSYIRIKAGADIGPVVNHIRNSIRGIDASQPIDIEFFDTVFANLYQPEHNISRMIFLFSLLAAVISIVGVFGLVIFESQYRIKEIAIRKVHGASIGSILLIFNRYYFKILLVCFVFAIPVAWYGVHEWLKGFVYKTPMYWWVYMLAFLMITFITLFTVTYQSWKAATVNPTKSIKTE